MKKIISLIALTLIVTFATAQSTTPRFGTTSANDNTGRVLTYGYINVNLSTAQASAYQIPNYYFTTIRVQTLTHALTDSVAVTYAHLGDHIEFVFTADTLTAGRVVTFGNHLKSAGTLTVAKSKKATAVFVFDGTAWIEEDRTICTN